MPAAIAAWRAGFWPVAAVSTWPNTTSEISAGAVLARFRASAMATWPSLWAGTAAKAPLNVPMAVRAAPAMTTSVMGFSWSLDRLVAVQLSAPAGGSHGGPAARGITGP